jgi:hypothetical protein
VADHWLVASRNLTGREHRQELGSLYVPILRIALIQLEVVLKAMRELHYRHLGVSY